MNLHSSRRVIAAAGLVVAGALALPAIADAAPAIGGDNGFAQGVGSGMFDYPPPPPPGDWYHPEWGPGWNNGYPAPGWVPPEGWAPPPDWNNPGRWAPPPGWCGGPVRDALHPRCWWAP